MTAARFAAKSRCAIAFAFAALALALGACTTNPATGEQSFTAFMSEAEEQRIGAQEHPKILAQFGGVYDDPAVAGYVAVIGGKLSEVSELPDLDFTFTVLNSDVVNAFALPGGYVYITRGLVALAGDEAQMASVIAHEIGHVTARHSAQRYSQAVLANLGTSLLGAVVGGGTASVAQYGAGLYLSSYSREQEYEADLLGVRYLGRVGYGTGAIAGFLRNLNSFKALQDAVAGRDGTGDDLDLWATHPRTADRVVAATNAAGAPRLADPRRGRNDFLREIDGMLFGDSPDQGYILGRRFAHPDLRFSFEVPDGFRMLNGTQQVVARHKNGAIIVFDAAKQPYSGPLTTYMRSRWAPGIELRDVEAISVNGMEAATGRTRLIIDGGTVEARLVAYRYSAERLYRFLFLTPLDQTERLSVALRETTYSFRRLSDAEAAQLKPRRIVVEAVDPGERVVDFARRMATDGFRERWFRVLNGLGPDEEPREGSLVKLVVR